jgi:hypothetical protein
VGKLYAVTFAAVAVSAAQDLFEITAAAGYHLYVHGFELAQTTEVGDAAEEGLALTLVRGYTVSGSGGSAATPVPLESGQGAANFSAEVNNTTVANTGSPVTLHATAWNERMAPCQWIYTPETRPHVGVSTRLVLRTTAPGDAVTMSRTMWVEEVG